MRGTGSRGIVLGTLLLVACESHAPRLDFPSAPVAAAPSRADIAQDAVPDRKLIRTGELQVRVKDVGEAAERTDSIVHANGGLTTNTRISQQDNTRRRADITLRVPVNMLGKTVSALKALGETTDEASTQQDITKDYVDLETRLAVREQELARLRELLANRTGKLSDVLEVEREITRVVTDIEQMKGARRYYDNQVEMATIALTLFEAGALQPAPGMSIGIALRQSLQALNTSAGLLIYVLTLLLPWIILGLVVRWLVGFWRRRHPE